MIFGKKKKMSVSDKTAAQNAAVRRSESELADATDAELRRKVRSDAFSFESSRIEMIEKSEARAWACAKGLGFTTVALALAVAAMMPLKTTVPYVFEVDKNTGSTELIEVADPKRIPHSTLMDKYWLSSYVRSRESYDYSVVDMEFNKVRELSLPNVFEPYKRQFVGENSLDRILGPQKSVRIELLSVMPEGNGIAQVRFIRRMINNGTMRPESESYWTAKIGYEYMPNYTRDGNRLLINPFGFKVTSYQLDQEFTRSGVNIMPQKPVETPLTIKEQYGIPDEPDEKELAEIAAAKAAAQAAAQARAASEAAALSNVPTVPESAEVFAPTVPASGQSPDGSTAPVMGTAPGIAGGAGREPSSSATDTTVKPEQGLSATTDTVESGTPPIDAAGRSNAAASEPNANR